MLRIITIGGVIGTVLWLIFNALGITWVGYLYTAGDGTGQIRPEGGLRKPGGVTPTALSRAPATAEFTRPSDSDKYPQGICIVAARP